jgi:hypothetical protein
MSKQLIYALSSLGEVPLSDYNEFFKTLYLPECDFPEDETEINYRGQIGRILESLGFVEFDFNKRKVFVCPPALVMLPSNGLPKAILTGARTPTLLKKIKKAIDKNKYNIRIYKLDQSKKGFSLPEVIFIEAANIQSLKDIAQESEIFLDSEIPACWKMANSSVSINNIESELVFIPREDINWKKKFFNTKQLKFSYQNDNTEGYRLVEYTNPLTQQKMHWIWNGKQASEIMRDWGRYLILKHSEKNVIIYDEEKEYLGVPMTIPLPRLLARAAALSSGKAPFIIRLNCTGTLLNELDFYIYTGIPKAITNVICEKLGQKTILTKINLRNVRGNHD